jgi:GT2 family glycosyltransferase
MIDNEVSTAAPERLPTVLVVLIVRNAAAWLRETLLALAAQDYPRLGLVAIDNASTDGSAEILEEALGAGRVRRLGEDRGFAGALDEVLAQSGAARADFLLPMHDDTILDPDSVRRLVEAAIGIPGVSGVGIVGGKVVADDDPRRLVDVGRSADRFGHAFSPLQPGEIDQGQFDRVLEVLAVHGAAMLIARDAWQAVGAPDDRIREEYADLDLCWRARVAGFRVLMTPSARIVHREDGHRGERGAVARRGSRFEEDRAALAAMLKNYGIVSLLLYLPLAIALGLVRGLYLLLSRRFEEAWDVVAAWWWNVRHLVGTLRRRRRVQRRRRVRDHALRRFTDSAGLRLPRWFQTAERILEEQREIEQEDAGRPVARRLRDRTASLVAEHPVIVASFVGAVVAGLATRHLLDPRVVMGGQLPLFPEGPGGIVRELASGVRTTGLGGAVPASPALGALAGLSWALVGSTSIAQKVILAGAPVMAAVLAYRAHVRATHRPGPSVVAAVGYAVSGVVLWSFSEGRIGGLVALAILPPLLERIEVAFTGADPGDRWRRLAGTSVTLAVGIAFEPGVLLAAVLAVILQVAFGRRRRAGLVDSALVIVGAAVLLFPFVPALAADGGRALGSAIFTRDVAALGRLVVAEAPGTWFAATFLPVGAVIALGLVGSEHRGSALRASTMATASLLLAWLAGAGWLPSSLSNAPIYVGAAAASMASVVAFGLASVRGLGTESFGARQLGTALLAGVLAAGIALQAIAASIGGWAVGGPDRVPAAWAVIEGADRGAFRVLWVGADDGRPFPAPGGDPEGLVEAGERSLRFAVTDRRGRGVVDLGRPLVGPGADRLAASLLEIASGTTAHGGALLAPFGVGFLVAEPGRLPEGVRDRLDAQVDLDVVPVTGLVIYRNAAALPVGFTVQPSDEQRALIRAGTLADTSRLRLDPVRPLVRSGSGWSGSAEAGGVAVLSTEFDRDWRADGRSEPVSAFGWATSFDVPPGSVRIDFGAQAAATIRTWVLCGLWLAALWITRKPVPR